MTDLLIKFGKYKGQRFSDVPNDYLVWMAKNFDKDFWLAEAVKELINRNEASVQEYNEDLVFKIWVARPDGRPNESVTLKVPITLGTQPPSPEKLQADLAALASVQDLIQGEHLRPMTFTDPPRGSRGMKVQDLPTPVVPPPEPPKAGVAASTLVQGSKLSLDVFATKEATEYLQTNYCVELAVLSSNVARAVTRFCQEVMLYGSVKEEKWVNINQECLVTFLYLDLEWVFSLNQGSLPQLERIEKPSC